MSAITKMLDHIKMTIPFEVLRVAFRDDQHNWRQAPTGLDNLIMEKVIKPRVLIDADLVGGSITIISVGGLTPKYVDDFSFIYEIPLDRTSNREIVSILSVGYLPYAGAFGYGTMNQPAMTSGSMNDVTSGGQRLMDSFSSIPVVSTATCDLIGYNTVIIRDSQRLSANYTLRCVIANDVSLVNINPRSWINFSELAALAVKSYIYNKLIIQIDQAYLSGGQELGSMKNYIDNLSDSEQMYQEYLRNVWQAVAFHNDSQSHERFIRIQISPGL